MPYDDKVVEFGDQLGVEDRIEAEVLDSREAVAAILENCLKGKETSAAKVPPDSWETLAL